MRNLPIPAHLCVALLFAAAGALPCSAYAPGDMNCDGLINFDDINPFVLVLSCPDPLCWENPTCPLLNADINGDDIVNFDDINPFVELLAGNGPRLAGHPHRNCDQSKDYCPADVVELTPSTRTLAVLHRYALYVCGVDDIEVELTIAPGVLYFDETEHHTDPPPPCLCCWDVQSWAIELDPGSYTVYYRWFDWDNGSYQVDRQQVDVP